MDTRLLETFVTVVRCRSFSAAADELFCTQSAVSQQIAALEAELGVALLRRRPVQPTEAGERLLRHAQQVLLRLETARLELSRLVAAPSSRLTLGVSPLAFGPRAARALDAVRQQFPRTDLVVSTAAHGDVTRGVATGRFDVGLVDGVAAPSDPLRLTDGLLDVEEVSQEPLVVVLEAGHPLAHRSSLQLDNLVNARWIDAAEVAANLTDLLAAVGSDAISAALCYKGHDISSLLELVAAGHGLAVLPAHVVRHAPGTVAVALGSPQLVHRVEVVHGSDLQPAGGVFIAALVNP